MKPILFNTDTLVFKEIPLDGCEDYRAANDGRIYSRTAFAGFGMKKYTAWYPLKECRNKKGYSTVSICSNGRKKSYCVHKLICLAFHGIPNKKLQVRHLDGTKDNNRPENLQWGTAVEDWEDKRRCGTATVGEKHPMSKLTDEQRREIIYKNTVIKTPKRQLAREYNVTQFAIQRIIRSKEKPLGMGDRV